MRVRAFCPSATHKKRRYLRKVGGASAIWASHAIAPMGSASGCGTGTADAPGSSLMTVDGGSTPSPTMLKVPGMSRSIASLNAAIASTSWTNWTSGSKPIIVGTSFRWRDTRPGSCGRPQDRRQAQDGDDRPLRALRETRRFVLGAELVAEERLALRGAERVALGEEVGVRGVGAVKKRLRPHHEFADLRVPRGDQDVHRPHARELVRPTRSRTEGDEGGTRGGRHRLRARRRGSRRGALRSSAG